MPADAATLSNATKRSRILSGYCGQLRDASVTPYRPRTDKKFQAGGHVETTIRPLNY
jgi:hypothetical protein